MIRPTLMSAALTVLAWPLSAQALSVLVGGVRAEYADSVSGTAGFMAGRLDTSTPTTATALEASFAQFVTGEWALQVSGMGTLVYPVNARLSAGIAGGGEANNVRDGTWSGSGSVGPIVMTTVSNTAVARLGVSVGGVRRVDEASVMVGTGTIGLQLFPRDDLVVEGGLSGVVSDSLQFLDATLGFSLAGGPLVATASAGARAGDLRDGVWASGSVAYALTPVAVMEAAVGRYPRDLTGFTDGIYGTLGIRMNLTQRARARWRRQPDSPFRVERSGGDRVEVSFRYPVKADALVEIVGDWNEWLPEALRQQSGGDWSIDLRLEPGVYKFALIVAGERWIIPEGVPSVPDEFGGEVGLLVVR